MLIIAFFYPFVKGFCDFFLEISAVDDSLSVEGLALTDDDDTILCHLIAQ